jgi:hypothetical protein
MFAAACCQRQALLLKPWQIPPCRIRDPDQPDRSRDRRYGEIDGRYDAARLLRQMYDLGISRWHPDPLAAIEERLAAIEKKEEGPLAPMEETEISRFFNFHPRVCEARHENALLITSDNSPYRNQNRHEATLQFRRPSVGLCGFRFSGVAGRSVAVIVLRRTVIPGNGRSVTRIANQAPSQRAIWPRERAPGPART